ncbi:MAG: trypsin-like peptidase domain-containing protein [Acidobacteriota bacterium]|nr:trypsin-like peptidase domain-containing protein [Acidobacteriota bacterium]
MRLPPLLSFRLVPFLPLVLLLAGPQTFGQVTRIADEEHQVIESPHPYPAGLPEGRVVWSTTLSWPEASYIAVHFERFELAEGDELILSDPTGRSRHRYTGRGPGERGGGFWGLSILGETMEIRLISYNPDRQAFGLVIDRWAHGFPLDGGGGEPDALCGTEDFRDVECYKDSYPTEYDVARRTVRLIKNGSAHCTGWIASCENHIITNEHCVGSQAELDQIEFQFEYKRPACGSGSPTVDLQLQGGTLLEVDAGLDYALILPDLAGNDPQATYGFMQWDVRLPDIDELIYIPGHPSGDPKRLSVESSDAHDESGRCEVFSTTEPACTGGPVDDVGYYCDTEGGSSGSAVVSAVSHAVIALHHCANCPNRGVPIVDVYNDIQASAHPLPTCVTCQPAGVPQDLVASTPADNQVLLDWSTVADAALYHVYRNDTTCADPMTEVGTSTTPSFLDENVAGHVTYNYKVTAASDCDAESDFSNCATVTPTGVCSEPPRFAGIGSADSAREGACGIDLGWEAATARCGTVTYNVYRSLFPDFEPAAGNLVASCVAGTTYRDTDVLSRVTYYYTVRAEDDSGFGRGPCNAGNEDSNPVTLAAAATGPEDIFYSDDFETGGSGWVLEGEWQIGVPQGKGGTDGGGSGRPDPTQALSGAYVLGHDISGSGAFPGNYENGLGSPENAISPAIDTTGRDEVRLRFHRWLNVASPADPAVVEGFDGNSWTPLWSSPDAPLYDDAWTLVDIDATAGLAGAAGARIRFAQSSDSSGVAAGWNVDRVELYQPTSCTSSTPNLPAVPDGKHAGSAMTAEKFVADGSRVDVQWDVHTCPGPAYHLFHGDSDNLPTYGYSDGVCQLDTSGRATVPLPDPAAGHFLWWVIVSADGDTEGIHGYNSAGGIRPARGEGLCGILDQSNSGSCP